MSMDIDKELDGLIKIGTADKIHQRVDNNGHQNKEEEEKPYICGFCYRQFAYNYTLTKHLREKHPTNAPPPVKSKKGMLCPICPTTKLHSIDSYLNHLKNNHKILLDKENFLFPSVEEFYKWKKTVETHHKYVQSRGGRTRVNGLNVTVYECHRSGMYVSRGEGKRKLKNQGSKKINGFCPAKIKASTAESGRVTVEFIKTHVGHDSGEEHILLSHEERDILAEMIKTKYTFDQIIEKLKNLPYASKRLQSVTKKDLHNVVCSYKLKEFVQQTHAKRTIKKLKIEENSGSDDVKLNETQSSIDVQSSEDTTTNGVVQQPNIILFPTDQNLITENIFIFDLTENPYIEHFAFEKEKEKLRHEFLYLLDAINTREQLETVKNILTPILPNLQSNNNSNGNVNNNNNNNISSITTGGDVTFNFTSLLDEKTAAAVKIYP